MRLSRILVAAGARPPPPPPPSTLAAALHMLPHMHPAPATLPMEAVRFSMLAAVPSPSLTGCLAIRRLHSMAAAPASARGHRAAILVKVGSGLFSLVKIPKAMGMDRISLLKTLQLDAAFSETLAGVALDKCAVHVIASTSKAEPQAAETAAARELRGAETLGDLAAGLAGVSLGAGANLFVRVLLPPRPGSLWEAGEVG
jgi:hypothetical protein